MEAKENKGWLYLSIESSTSVNGAVIPVKIIFITAYAWARTVKKGLHSVGNGRLRLLYQTKTSINTNTPPIDAKEIDWSANTNPLL